MVAHIPVSNIKVTLVVNTVNPKEERRCCGTRRIGRQKTMPGPWIEHGTSRRHPSFSLLLSQLSYPGDEGFLLINYIM